MIWFQAWVIIFLDFDCNVLEPKPFWTWSWIILSLNLNTFALETMIQLCSALAPFVSSLSLNYVVLQLHLFWAWASIISVPFLRHFLVQPSLETQIDAEVEFCPEPLIRLHGRCKSTCYFGSLHKFDMYHLCFGCRVSCILNDRHATRISRLMVNKWITWHKRLIFLGAQPQFCQ